MADYPDLVASSSQLKGDVHLSHLWRACQRANHTTKSRKGILVHVTLSTGERIVLSAQIKSGLLAALQSIEFENVHDICRG